MSNHELLTDDYVADLLAKDAQDCSIKYSAMGMEAFRSNKKPANMPKPNTRFLRHIIKDTDTHNKALLAKEAAESKARLEDLEQSEEVKRLKTNPNTRDIRRRQLGDIHAILGAKKRRPAEEENGEGSSRDSKGKKRSRESDRTEDRSSKSDDLFRERHRDRRSHGRLDDQDEDRSRRKEGKSRRRHHDRDSEEEEDRHRHSRRRRRHRSRSPHDRKRRSRSPDKDRQRQRSRSPTRREESKRPAKDLKDDDDTDPLEDLIGPMPVPKPRGRGLAGSSGIDRRFSETYDPKNDVRMDSDDDVNAGGDWSDAAEAFRDRAKLKQQQESRLKSAGFTEEQIQKLEPSGSDSRPEDNVKWAQAGEKREWDKGKDLDLDLDLDL